MPVTGSSLNEHEREAIESLLQKIEDEGWEIEQYKAKSDSVQNRVEIEVRG